MALTFTGPGNYSSVQDDLYFIASSEYSGSTDFKYVYDIWVDGVQKIRSKVYPDPTTGKGYFDAGPIVRNEINYDWFTPYKSTAASAPFLKNVGPTDKTNGCLFSLRLGYELSGTTYINQVSGNTISYNFSAPLYKRKQVTYQTKNGTWWTNRPLNAKCNITQKLLIPVKWEGIAPEVEVYLIIRANNKSPQYGYYVADSTTNVWQLDIGPETINRYLNTSYIDSTVSYYDVSFYTDDIGSQTPNFRVYIDCHPNYNPISLFFINQWGVFDTAAFNLVSKLSLETERKSFNKLNKTFGNTSVNYYTDTGDGMRYNESKINFASKTNWTYKLTMDYPTDGEYQWLSELILSPQIYAELNGDYYPVTIKNTNFEYNQNIVNGLKTLDLEIELNQTRYAFTR
jgi:hypothetical protein